MLKGPHFGLIKSGKKLASITQVMLGSWMNDLSTTEKVTVGVHFNYEGSLHVEGSWFGIYQKW